MLALNTSRNNESFLSPRSQLSVSSSWLKKFTDSSSCFFFIKKQWRSKVMFTKQRNNFFIVIISLASHRLSVSMPSIIGIHGMPQFLCRHFVYITSKSLLLFTLRPCTAKLKSVKWLLVEILHSFSPQNFSWAATFACLFFTNNFS